MAPTKGGSAATIAFARSIATKRGLPGQNTRPIADAPSSAASRASSIVVTPQILTRVISFSARAGPLNVPALAARSPLDLARGDPELVEGSGSSLRGDY